jgi:NOL1/NOP2/fmu family ribosome biogenesis protein
VQLCSQRQQRILADVWPALKKDGILIYSTCSYSKEEDEDIVNWLLNELPITYCPLSIDKTWGITETDKGYRFWPDKVKGEGFFLACFRKTDDEETYSIKAKKKAEPVTKKELVILEKWVDTEGNIFIKNNETIYAWPKKLSTDFNLLLNQLRVLYSGTIIGAIVRDKLIPDHALAMNALQKESIEKTSLNYDEAISYLKRKDLQIEPTNKGWQLVTYEGHSLGWINALPNRINNYYPKELRILKDI